MRTEEELKAELKKVRKRMDYWRENTAALMACHSDSDQSYANYRYWVAREESLEFALGIRGPLSDY